MEFELLEVVVLLNAIERHNLKSGDLGTVVEVYDGGLEVEFVTADGKTQAVVTLDTTDVRKVQNSDMIAVRSVQPTH